MLFLLFVATIARSQLNGMNCTDEVAGNLKITNDTNPFAYPLSNLDNNITSQIYNGGHDPFEVKWQKCFNLTTNVSEYFLSRLFVPAVDLCVVIDGDDATLSLDNCLLDGDNDDFESQLVQYSNVTNTLVWTASTGTRVTLGVVDPGNGTTPIKMGPASSATPLMLPWLDSPNVLRANA
ncbi:hypothetical protein DACRYDRAFT_106995 [Dacryopinax primogenitus]|uniref:Uncharacterized protein n=1 Tax=Dacryopinax primogenitus (strain DJM 731) TaxID=1858805 RepID=M5GE24_DACPD|nr:uncharacterized protein DACRYDRAFT_106995 [Dacryopinax primogenitus]EJU02913.1 hypothetical protein DACRYDRAFT_106995 [Dacryopinax primogenitus]